MSNSFESNTCQVYCSLMYRNSLTHWLLISPFSPRFSYLLSLSATLGPLVSVVSQLYLVILLQTLTGRQFKVASEILSAF